jgi:hypothetical protein
MADRLRTLVASDASTDGSHALVASFAQRNLTRPGAR